MRRRYVYENGEMVEVGDRTVHSGLLVIPDIEPYQSMVDGRMIQGRRQHREHLRAHQLIEIGDQTHYLKPKGYTPAPGLKDTIIREVHRAKDAQRAGRKYEPNV